MKIRTECPKNNKYYIRTVTGGLNGAVAGDPTQPYANVLDNCVGYANGRFNEIWNDPELEGIAKKFHVQLTCNAENFIESAKRQGLKISSTPVVGGIMVWQKGATLSGGDGAGHVAVVERVYDDGTILTSESGWASWAFKTVRRDNSNGRWSQNSYYKFRGCIINPNVKNVITPAPKLAVDGIGGACTVRAMQRFFGTVQDGVLSGQNKSLNKYYPALKAVEYGKGGSPCVKNLQKWVGVSQDGIIGEATVKAWQKKIDVTADGIFGTNSMKAWQKYLNEHDKAVYPIVPETWVDKANAWAKKIANDNSYHYVLWKSKDAKTHECPICHNHPKGAYHGWNCIGFAFACWHHGGGLKCRCSNGVVANEIWEKILSAKTDAEALALARKHVGLTDIKVIRNKNNIPHSQWKAGDICAKFSGSKYIHTYYYMGGGKIAESTGSSGKVPINDQIRVKAWDKHTAKVIIRYLGK